MSFVRLFGNCLVVMRIVEGTRFIQLERRGLHHINSHVGHMMVARNLKTEEILPELMEESDDKDDWDGYTDDFGAATAIFADAGKF